MLLVNMPAPYRVPVYDRLAAALGSGFRVIYMGEREHDRKWDVPVLRHDHVFLRGFAIKRAEGMIHVRAGVGRELRTFRPDVVMTCGFNPPMLSAWLLAIASRIAHIPISDAWRGSELHLTRVHRWVRKAVFASSQAFIGASVKALEMFGSYGARKNLFQAPLGVDNARFGAAALPMADRPFDLVFAGNLIERKMPGFFVDVVARLALTRAGVKVLVIGSGALREPVERALAAIPNVTATFTGFLQQAELPAAYASGKVFCFPTLYDAWGVVANEACASGMPVVTCDNAGCAGELVVHERNGYVLPVDAKLWADRLRSLLANQAMLADFGASSIRQVAPYTFDAARDGILSACSAV